MAVWIVVALAGLLTAGAVLRGAWPLAVAAWSLLGLGAIAGDDYGPLVVALGAVVLVLGGLSLTRGAIFEGSPKADLPEMGVALYVEEDEDDWDVDSVHFTHSFWGPR